MSKENTPPPVSRDPKAGCLIMLIIAAVVGGLLTIVISTPFTQAGAMSEFTETQPADIFTKEALPTTPAALEAKLSQFQSGITNTETETVSLQLTKEDLNSAIRSFQEFEELQGTMAVKEITPEEMLFDISFKLRARPFSDEIPYLNGVMHAVPELLNDEIVLNISHIDSEKGEVPEGFLQHLKPYRIMSKYSDHEVLGRFMFACHEVVLEQGKLSLKVMPSKFADPEALEFTGARDNSKRKKNQAMNFVITFLLVGGAFIFLVKRRNAKAAATWKNG